ncbi:MAG: hypothetical protein KAJ24_02265, partial [Candidatus Aenigmarchaeota archaeon]|nr:hypothetical protein [Candidatus Aenigmarchaeota archaeon]
VKSGSILNFTVYANDNDNAPTTNVSSVFLKNNTILAMNYIGEDTWSLLTSTTALGCSADNCTMTARAVDDVGNENTTTYALIVDNTLPTLLYFKSNASNNISTSNVTLNFTVNANDDDGITGNLSSVRINGTNMNYADNNVWYLLSNASALGCNFDGECTLVAEAADKADNIRTSTYIIIINDAIPSINITLSPRLSDNSPQFYVNTSEKTTCEYKTDYSPTTYAIMNSTGEQYHSQIMPQQNITYLPTGGQYAYIQHQNYMNGNHTLYVNCTDVAGTSNEASFNFTIKPPLMDRVFYQEDTCVVINLSFQKSGLNLFANFSSIDSGYNSTHNETIIDYGDGTYNIRYNISIGNTRPKGQYKVYVIAEDAGNITSNTSTYLHLHKSSDWVWADVDNALTCMSGNPGWYFNEFNCNWDADVNFANKKSAGGSVEDRCNDNSDNDGDTKTDCFDMDCSGVLYSCRQGNNISSALPLEDPCSNNICTIPNIGGSPMTIYYLQNVRPGENLKVLFVQNSLSNKSVLLQVNEMNGFNLADETTTLSQLPTKIVSSTSLTARSYTPDGNDSNDRFTGNLSSLLSILIPSDASQGWFNDTAEVLRSIDDAYTIKKTLFNFSVNSTAIVYENDSHIMDPEKYYCNDDVDNDLNDHMDCKEDINCNNSVMDVSGHICEFATELNCTDSFDNDDMSDGTDCIDSDCDSKQGNATNSLHKCEYNRELNCTDGFDNDARNVYDCIVNDISTPSTSYNDAEYDCASSCRANSIIPTNENGSTCLDNKDNDLDFWLLSGSYGYVINDSGGFDCRWTNYDTDCNNTLLSSGYQCQLNQEINCTDGFDNDFDQQNTLRSNPGYFNVYGGNNSADCDDYDCYSATNATGQFICTENMSNTAAPQEITCDDNVDNDLDDLFDCADPDCVGRTGPFGGPCALNEHPDYCGDGFDNDGDNAIDCVDSDCWHKGPNGALCSPCPSFENISLDSCGDGIDNDNSDGTDCSDPDCAGNIGPNNQICEVTESICDDGLDNDGDSKIDCLDSNCGCYNDELGPGMCSDSIDNDFDTNADCNDTDCLNTAYCLANDAKYPSTKNIMVGIVNVTYNDVIHKGENMALDYYATDLSGQSVILSVGTSTHPLNQFVDSPYDSNTVQSWSGSGGNPDFIKSSNSNNLQSENSEWNGWFNVTHMLAVSPTATTGTYTLEIRTSITGSIDSKIITVYVLENEKPTTNITSPLNGSVVNNSNVTVSVNATDMGVYNSGIGYCEFRND